MNVFPTWSLSRDVHVAAGKFCQVARHRTTLREGKALEVKGRNEERDVQEQTGPSIFITHYSRKWITRNYLAIFF
jgi:hypothetical protein